VVERRPHIHRLLTIRGTRAEMTVSGAGTSPRNSSASTGIASAYGGSTFYTRSRSRGAAARRAIFPEDDPTRR
jgi:hypothetical protein